MRALFCKSLFKLSDSKQHKIHTILENGRALPQERAEKTQVGPLRAKTQHEPLAYELETALLRPLVDRLHGRHLKADENNGTPSEMIMETTQMPLKPITAYTS